MAVFSVVVATHRRPRFLRRAIASVRAAGDLAQLIVVSDAACPTTCEIVTADLGPHDLFIQRGGPPGPAESRNIGARIATGRFIVFLDDDDALSPTFLADVLPHLDGPGVVYTDFVQVLEQVDDTTSSVLKAEHRSLAGLTPAGLTVKNFIPNSCAVYPRAVAQARSFDPSVGYEDWDFLLNVMTDVPLRHVPVCGPVIYSRAVPDNRGDANEADLVGIYRTIYKRWPAPDGTTKAARRSLLASAGITAELADL